MARNQYNRDDNGPNAHKKGNRSASKRDTTAATDISKRISDDIGRYKEIADRVRRSKKYRQEDIYTIYVHISEYIAERTTGPVEEQRPLTVSGIIRASGISKSTWYEMLGGGYDYRLYEYMDLHSIDTHTHDVDGIPAVTDQDGATILLIPYSEILQKAMLAIEEQTEERLYSKGRVGDIFSLKAIHGWQEETSPHTVNQTLVIASEEQARKAIEALK